MVLGFGPNSFSENESNTFLGCVFSMFFFKLYMHNQQTNKADPS